ncbi:MAG: chorismate-binding protein [Muribaculaceae bacterium]|nr:chorismate-binding protein [Muribaculaceae bacterium]MDE6134139.1 chorismate-binding protein [Muribaculaceae bacterium]
MAFWLDNNRELILSGRPFIAYREPGEIFPVVEAGEGSLKFGRVTVDPWPGSAPSPSVPSESTSRRSYTETLDALISQLKQSGGKTVVQRVINGSFKAFDPLAMLDAFFVSPTSTFDFVLFDPSAAWWIGRSPELLLETEGRTFRTRALAGTRPRGVVGEWSSKNRDEHEMVVADICSRLDGLCLKVTRHPIETFDCGAVSHLMTPISVGCLSSDVSSDVLFRRIVEEIHPTPAVGGFPREHAVAAIPALESHERQLYGGVISVASRCAYVVLRCAHFDSSRWAVHTGSGITACSDADDEWYETQAKASPLVEFLSRF